MNLLRSMTLLGATTLLACAPAFAQLLDGGFESGTPVSAGVGATVIPVANTPWTVAGDVADTYITSNIPGGNFYPQAGTYSATFAGVSESTLTQTFSDTAGTKTDLNFYLYTYAPPGNTSSPYNFAASWDGTQVYYTTQTAQGPYMLISVPVTETASDTLVFTGENTNNIGFYELDSVSVGPTPSATTTSVTPEPSSLILLGTGILGVAGAARRRFLRA